MSRRSLQRLCQGAKYQQDQLVEKKQCFQILPLVCVAFVVSCTLIWIYLHTSKINADGVIQATSLKLPKTLKELLVLSPADFEHCDIARMNLLCAEGLPSAEHLDVDEALAMLDFWAQHVKSETDRNFHDYREDPAYYYNSTNFYKMAMMARVFYEDYNIRYNPKWISSPGSERPDDHFFADSSDVFISGLIADKHLGTCSSMPVLYVALGRRLGYPLKLVTTKQHLFIRWDSPTEKFDMDATSKGVDHYDDSFYRQWPFPISDKEIKEEGYLKSLSPREELSVFMSIRGFCQTDSGLLPASVESFKAAYQLEPSWKYNQFLLARVQKRQYPTRNP